MRINERKGITLISLVVTVAVLLILASIATYSGVEVIRSSKFDKFTTELKLMQTKVNELYDKYTSGEDTSVINLGLDISQVSTQANKVFTSSASGITDKSGYRYFNKSTINSLGIEGVDGEFFVNVQNRSVISYEGMKYEGKTFYTLAQLPDGLYNVNYENRNVGEISFDLTSSSYTINVSNIQYDGYIDKWQVKYQKEGQDYWSTSEDLSFDVSEGGEYSVKLANGDVESEVKKIEVIVFDGSWNDKKGINMPMIDGKNMTLVKWDSTKKEWVEDKDGSSINYVSVSSGDNNSSQWANAQVKVNGINNYFVWIPRYEYKIDSSNKKIEIKFIPTDKTTADSGYTIHPAFTSNVNNGGWSRELPGIWVGKYESSIVNRSDNGNINTNSTSKGNIIIDSTHNTDKTIAVQPNLTSWRYAIIGNFYTSAIAFSEELNSHMMKNSEWGAVAYLTHSQYGRNGTEVTVNDSSTYTTGDGDIVANVKQSTTGNVYGIYDFSGGASEYLAAYYNGSTSLTTYGGSFAKNAGISTEFVTVYTGTNINSNSILGDAIKETNNWNSDAATFLSSSKPFFRRGGYKTNGSTAGIFAYSYSDGAAGEYRAFRLCLVVDEV